MDMLPRMWVLLAICTIVIDNILWLKGKGTIYSHIFMYIFICLHIYIHICTCVYTVYTYIEREMCIYI